MLELITYLFVFAYSAKKFNATTVDFVSISNYSDLFEAMRQLHNSTNLTRDGFIIVKNSSSYDNSQSSRKTVDCIVQHPMQFFDSRFVTGANDTDSWITLDFLTSKVTLRHYTIYYAKQRRFMVDYVLYGEEASSWKIIDRRVVKPGDFETINTPKGEIWAYSYNVTTPLRNYSRLMLKDIGDNVDQMENMSAPISHDTKKATTLAKLLFYGTIYPETVRFSPIKLKRKEQMMFNFAMFSSL
ncbi:hypothetical protein TVAG_009370 [Trichomonas vaginalis G3]|uniref:F5/8 type C domain-containing protein n=1 Tax=Trichomonas vaginalis (strain ATCC PRA-98 / G3) TaxID=412133 RepID=A2FYV5_TRIV3|nr:hypothetical protein TVAGG3_0416410 [Trichomonas vaginalis G3]EAX89917.1 hypothetical protein TVAG_009370 [Trichomonas vaginalis G3]KAI5535736.1 hypothetical protein TVAGG3_0416410 [Trichomonas vaginalis G3]|eukprot:XP_001302847.1 hypothetical protein [Trichomonas vaginalis G3]